MVRIIVAILFPFKRYKMHGRLLYKTTLFAINKICYQRFIIKYVGDTQQSKYDQRVIAAVNIIIDLVESLGSRPVSSVQDLLERVALGQHGRRSSSPRAVCSVHRCVNARPLQSREHPFSQSSGFYRLIRLKRV